MDRNSLQRELESGVAALRLSLPAGAVEKLMDYLALLIRWNGAYNLTAVRQPQEMVTRHLLDSLSILPFVQGKTLADFGSGAGLPGIPLAIALPHVEVTLADSNGKKVRFLREAIRALPLPNARAVQARVQELDGAFECVTARAFASLRDMLEWGGHALAARGVWLALKGRVEADEAAEIPPEFRVCASHRLVVPGLDAERHVLEIRRA